MCVCYRKAMNQHSMTIERILELSKDPEIREYLEKMMIYSRIEGEEE